MLAWWLRRVQYWLLKAAIKRTGYIAPVLVSRNGVVLDGNRRVQAARELGISVPAVYLDIDVQMVDPDTLVLSCPVRPER